MKKATKIAGIVIGAGIGIGLLYYLSEKAKAEGNEIKQKVKEFYKKATEEKWWDWEVYANEKQQFDTERCVAYRQKDDCPSDSLIGFIDGPALGYGDWCSEMPDAQRNFLVEELGFELETQCFWCEHADGSASGVNACHIKYNGRYLTANELWLPEVKQLAIDLGYDIRDCSGEPECHIGWGFWGETENDAFNALMNFREETGIWFGSASLIRYFPNGYLYVIDSLYACGLYNATKEV